MMRGSRLSGLLALMLVLPTSLLAQRGAEGRGYIWVSGGIGFAGQVWSIEGQQLRSQPTNGGTVGILDTISVRRDLTPGGVFNLGGAGFPLAHLGFGLDLTFVALRYEDDCTVTSNDLGGPNSDANNDVCAFIRTAKGSVPVIGLNGVTILRPLPYSGLTPLVKFMGGFSNLSDISEVDGFNRTIIEGAGGGFHPTVGVALGMSRPTDEEAQFRFEARYQLHRATVLAGPGNEVGVAPLTRDWVGNLVVTLGIDFVLGE